MEFFRPTEAYPLFLRATLPRSVARNQLHLDLDDGRGNQGTAEVDLGHLSAPSNGNGWDAFHRRYVDQDTGEVDHRSFGSQLFELLFMGDPSIRQAWQGIQTAAEGRPLALTVTFGSQTERLARLPLELLHNEAGFLFARPGSALRRAFLHMQPKAFAYPQQPRLLLAWACPPGGVARYRQNGTGSGDHPRLDGRRIPATVGIPADQSHHHDGAAAGIDRRPPGAGGATEKR